MQNRVYFIGELTSFLFSESQKSIMVVFSPLNAIMEGQVFFLLAISCILLSNPI